MGQKVNPISMRLQVNKDWRSKWFVGKREYAKYLAQDLEVRRMIQNKLGSRAAINKVDIERSPNLVTVTVTTAKAGVVIGRGGAGATEPLSPHAMTTTAQPIRPRRRPAARPHRISTSGLSAT